MDPYTISKEEIMNLEPQFLLKEGNILTFTFFFLISFLFLRNLGGYIW